MKNIYKPFVILNLLAIMLFSGFVSAGEYLSVGELDINGLKFAVRSNYKQPGVTVGEVAFIVSLQNNTSSMLDFLSITDAGGFRLKLVKPDGQEVPLTEYGRNMFPTDPPIIKYKSTKLKPGETFEATLKLGMLFDLSDVKSLEKYKLVLTWDPGFDRKGDRIEFGRDLYLEIPL